MDWLKLRECYLIRTIILFLIFFIFIVFKINLKWNKGYSWRKKIIVECFTCFLAELKTRSFLLHHSVIKIAMQFSTTLKIMIISYKRWRWRRMTQLSAFVAFFMLPFDSSWTASNIYSLISVSPFLATINFNLIKADFNFIWNFQISSSSLSRNYSSLPKKEKWS